MRLLSLFLLTALCEQLAAAAAVSPAISCEGFRAFFKLMLINLEKT